MLKRAFGDSPNKFPTVTLEKIMPIRNSPADEGKTANIIRGIGELIQGIRLIKKIRPWSRLPWKK